MTIDNKRVFKQLEILKANFSWYQRMVQRSPNIGFSELPIIDQDILDQNYYSIEQKLSNPLIYFTSGTSSGKRKKIYYSHLDHQQYLKQREDIFSRYLDPTCKIACSDLGTGHAADSATAIFKSLGLKTYKINFTTPIEWHLSILNKSKPDVLFTMPMILDKIIQTGKLNITLKKLFLVGDITTNSWQEQMAHTLKINRSDIIDLYGSIEIGSIAFFNHNIGCYQFQDHIYPETIRVAGKDILLLTSFTRSYFPAIRYQTNDLIEDLSYIRINNKNVWVFKRIIGRVGEEFKLGEKISFYDILHCLEKYLPISHFNIIENNFGVEILIPEETTNSSHIDLILDSLRMTNEDIKNLIKHGLVNDFKVRRVPIMEIENNHFKRRFLKR